MMELLIKKISALKMQEPKENKGCPDTDFDGILDHEDNCIKIAGPIENNGCPWPDTDGDGVLDKDDHCIDIPGLKSNHGCMVIITDKAMKQLDEFARTLHFTSGSSKFESGVIAQLDQIALLMKEFKNAKFSLNGYTDSIGSKKLNVSLSQQRVNAVRDYLISKGIDGERLVAKGYGEENPITTNFFKEGRAKNRRVEINLIK